LQTKHPPLIDKYFLIKYYLCMSYTNMSENEFLRVIANDLQQAGARLLQIAMGIDDREQAEPLIRASEAVLIAARKARKHLDAWNESLLE